MAIVQEKEEFLLPLGIMARCMFSIFVFRWVFLRTQRLSVTFNHAQELQNLVIPSKKI